MKKENIVIITLIVLFAISILISFSKIIESPSSATIDPMLTAHSGIALIHLNGPISASPVTNMFQPIGGIDSVINQFNRIETDKKIKAVVLRINSPGGTAAASQELYEEIIKFKKRTKKPVIVSIADITASGGYWVALSADTIFANPCSLVGSIGVILNNLDISELSEKYGINMTTIKSAKYKDIFSSWRKVTDMEEGILQKLVADIHKQFVDTLISSRKLKRRKAESLADGQIYTGKQAKKLGLIDKLGGLQDSIKYAAKCSNIKTKPKIYKKNVNPMYQLFDFFKQKRISSFFDIFAQMNNTIENVY